MYSLPQIQPLERRSLFADVASLIQVNPNIESGDLFRMVFTVTGNGRPENSTFTLDTNRNGRPDPQDRTATPNIQGRFLSPTFLQTNTTYLISTAGLAPGPYLLFRDSGFAQLPEGVPNVVRVIQQPNRDPLDPADDQPSTAPLLVPNRPVVHTLNPRSPGGDFVDYSRIVITQPTRIQIRLGAIRGSFPSLELRPLDPGPDQLIGLRPTDNNFRNLKAQPTVDAILQPGTYVLTVSAASASQYTLSYDATPTNSGLYVTSANFQIGGPQVSGRVSPDSGITSVALVVDRNLNGLFDAADGSPVSTTSVSSDLQFKATNFSLPLNYLFAVGRNAQGQIVDSVRFLPELHGSDPFLPFLITNLKTTLTKPANVTRSIPLTLTVQNRLPGFALPSQDYTFIAVIQPVDGDPVYQYIPMTLAFNPLETKTLRLNLPFDSAIAAPSFSLQLGLLGESPGLNFNPENRVSLSSPRFKLSFTRITASNLTYTNGRVSFTLTNSGNRTATLRSALQLIASLDSSLSDTDPRITTLRPSGSLAPNRSRTFTFRLSPRIASTLAPLSPAYLALQSPSLSGELLFSPSPISFT